MEPAYAYFIFSIVLLAIWLILFVARADIRREMFWVSFGTMFLGLTEPFFVPEYWDPPTLWDLARKTGFDLESLLFSFAVGGVVFSAYDVIFGLAPSESIFQERMDRRHRYHLLVILSAPVISVILMNAKLLNPIYSATIGMTAGFFATLYCRTDLWLKMVVSGVLFVLLYFIAFALFNTLFPGYVAAVWNLKAISGLLLGGVPIEELLFAFTFGLYWSSTYEHLAWRRNRPLSKRIRTITRSRTDDSIIESRISQDLGMMDGQEKHSSRRKLTR